MNIQRLMRICAVAGLALVGGCAASGGKMQGGNTLGNPAGMVDHLVKVESAEGFERGEMKGVEVVTGGDGVARVELTGGETKAYPKVGSWTSEVVKTEFPFTELIPSWNLKTPGETGVYFEVRVREGGEWSPWMYIGYWGRVRTAGKRVENFGGGKVNLDNLKLSKAADAYQIRGELESFEAQGAGTPMVRRVSVVYSGVVKDEKERARLAWKPEVKGDWAVDLKVPYRAQGDSTEALSGEICSPTSTSMVMQYLGVNRPTVENAEAIYDNDAGMFGNWGRAVARAGEMGLDGWVMRFRNWDQVKAMISQGQPIICSIRAKKGDFHGPHIYDSTKGHLIVIRGLTAEGNAIVNDPARRAKGDGFVYNQDDIKRVWLDHGGVGYIIRKAEVPKHE